MYKFTWLNNKSNMSYSISKGDKPMYKIISQTRLKVLIKVPIIFLRKFFKSQCRAYLTILEGLWTFWYTSLYTKNIIVVILY